MPERALVLANGLLSAINAKTTHALIRGPSRYDIVAVIDPASAGRDAGEVLDGRRRGIPVVASVRELLATTSSRPEYCVIGVATPGGVLPDDLRRDLLEAGQAGLSLVNGLHQPLSEDEELVRITRRRGARIIDLRKPRPFRELRFWSGEIRSLATPRIAVLGTDCAIGKRTTCSLLTEACRRRGVAAEMIYTGQTGWLQGARYGFIFDATPNDFVSGELEGAILACHREANPAIMFLEGQSALRNPSGPCGLEFILSAEARGVVLQHAPARRYFIDMEELGCRIPPLESEIELIRQVGGEVLAVTLNTAGLDGAGARRAQSELEARLGIPVACPLDEGVDALAASICQRFALGHG